MRNAMCLLVGTALLCVSACQKAPVATAPAAVSEQPLAGWKFDETPVGKLPEHFVPKENNPTKAMAAWAVAADPAAPSTPNVLTVNTENANATYNLALIEGTSFGDVDVRVQVRGNTGTEDQGGGLIWRARDENNYYVCRINPLEPNFRVYKVIDGKRKQLQTVEVATETGKWYSVRAVMRGDHIECYVDGRKLLDVQDGDLKDAGMIGLWTKADASSSFDNLSVFKPAEGAAATAAAR